jgi:hypothetical protein
MAGRMVSGHTEILLTSDSDQLALLGDVCVSIKNWHFKTKDKINTLEGLDIFTGSEITMNAILNFSIYSNRKNVGSENGLTFNFIE